MMISNQFFAMQKGALLYIPWILMRPKRILIFESKYCDLE